MNPQYYVRAAPRHLDPRYAFSAFSIRPAEVEFFDIAHVILIADAVVTTGATISAHDGQPIATTSQQAVALIRQIMQQETALPVVRRLVEALRQVNTVCYTEKQGVRLVAGLLIKNTLYLTCVGAMSAYVMRADKVQLLLRAERTRNRYLGSSAQLQLDYQLPVTASAFTGSATPYAYLSTDRFLLAPDDTLILCSTELPLEVIKSATFYKRQPERLAIYLSKAAVRRQNGQVPGIIALHWHVDRFSQTAKQLLLVLSLFLCVTATMQTVSFFNRRLEQWLAVHATASTPPELPPILYGTTPVAGPIPVAPSATVTASTAVQVTVDVNVDVTGDPARTEHGPGAALETDPSAAPKHDRPLAGPTRTWSAREQASVLPLVTTAATSRLALVPIVPTPTPPLPLATVPAVPVPATATSTLLPTVLPTATALTFPAVISTPAPIVAAPAVLLTVQADNAPGLASPTPSPVALSVSLLEPPDQVSSSDLLTFAWQGSAPLLPGQAYEVIVWRPDETPLEQGLGVAPPGQAQQLTISLSGLYDAGVVRPGIYRWGVLLVTVEPYTRLTFLTSERTFTFDIAARSSACNPERESC